MRAGFGSIVWSGWINTLIFIIVAPMLGMGLGFGMMALLMWLFHKHPSSKINGIFRKLQLVSAAFYSLGHGANDAQKTMGIITIMLINAQFIQTTGPNDFPIKWWVIIPCYTAISIGTMFGGWRIVKTMGQKVTKLKPVGGFCAETAGAFTLLITAFSGIAVSTYTYYYGRNYGSRCNQTYVGCEVGTRRKNCCCVGNYNPGVSNCLCQLLLDYCTISIIGLEKIFI